MVTGFFDDLGERQAGLAMPCHEKFEWLVVLPAHHSVFRDPHLLEEGLIHQPSHLRSRRQVGPVTVTSPGHGRFYGVERFPVLSEDEYLEKSSETSRRLCEAFTDADVVIVGSSLTDPPLLDALWRTQKTERRRLAILPLQQWTYENETHRDEIIDEVRNRLITFNVEPVFPDFYFQVAQFLRECVVSSKASPGAYKSRRSRIRYGSRLLSWWNDWYSATATDLEAIQAVDHEYLASHLRVIRRTLGARRGENLKVEVWIRWEPTETHRVLRLWSSSVGTWPDESSMREGPIEPDSRYASVQAFCQGRPVLLPGTGELGSVPDSAVPRHPSHDRSQLLSPSLIVLVHSPPQHLANLSVGDIGCQLISLPGSDSLQELTHAYIPALGSHVSSWLPGQGIPLCFFRFRDLLTWHGEPPPSNDLARYRNDLLGEPPRP